MVVSLTYKECWMRGIFFRRDNGEIKCVPPVGCLVPKVRRTWDHWIASYLNRSAYRSLDRAKVRCTWMGTSWWRRNSPGKLCARLWFCHFFIKGDKDCYGIRNNQFVNWGKHKFSYYTFILPLVYQSPF
jgi:hypothetical protein